MSKISITLFILAAFSVSYTTSNAQELLSPKIGNSDEQVEQLERRLKQLEPPEPITIVEPPEEAEAKKYYPSDTIPISEVIDKGTRIPFNIIINDPNFKRPVYEEHWHSTYWGADGVTSLCEYNTHSIGYLPLTTLEFQES